MIKAIHIEDEPRNIELMQSLLSSHCSDLVTLCGHAGNKADAMNLIRAVKPQLVYLDIELNQGNAFELLETLNAQHELDFHVIFITAFNHYAVRAFRYNAVDYLLKPISITELIEATRRAVERITHPAGGGQILELIQHLRLSVAGSKIGVPVLDGVLFVNVEQIIRAEAKGSYTVLYLQNGEKVTATKNLKDMEVVLPELHFLRVHHSWLVNTKYMKKYYRGKNSYIEMEDGAAVPVSIRKKGKFLDFLT